MSRALTKAQLAAQLEAAHVSYQLLEAKYAQVCAQHSVLESAVTEHAAAKRNVRQLSDAAVIAHDNYARALLAAREMALRTGRSVRVG